MNKSIHEIKGTQIFLNTCIQTKNIYSLLDLPKDDDQYKKMSKHLETCPNCKKEFQIFQLKNMANQIYIPKVIMDKDLRQLFEREISELFKVMDLNKRELMKKNVKKGFVFIDKMGIEFIHNLSSRSMFKAYVFAIVIFVSLKYILN